MSDDENAAINAVMKLLDAKGYRGGSHIRAYNVVHNLALVGLTPADIAGLADGTRVVVPVEGMHADGPVVLDNGCGPTPVGVPFNNIEQAQAFAAALAARPGAKEG